jgi:hypothetical protein
MTDLSDRETEVLRAMGPTAKLATMQALIRQAYELKIAWLRVQAPHLTEAEVWAKASQLVAGGRP